MKKEIEIIQYLRAIAALAVVFFHFRTLLNESNQLNITNLGDILFSTGGFGVDLFFVISGFVIAISTEKNIGRLKNTITFSLKRIFRIYPLLIICVMLSYLIHGGDILYIIKSMIPLQANYNSEAPFFGYNLLLVAWTLTYELFFYLLFSVSMAISHKYRAAICIAIISCSFVVTQLYTFGSISLNVSRTYIADISTILHAPISLISSPMMLEFCLGIISYYIYKKSNSKFEVIFNNGTKPYLWLLSFVLIFFLVIENPISGHGVANWGVISFLLLVTMTLYEKFLPIQSSYSLKLTGDISYSMYMIHMLLFPLIIFIKNETGITGIPMFALSIVIIMAASLLSFNIMEKPISTYCNKFIRNKIP